MNEELTGALCTRSKMKKLTPRPEKIFMMIRGEMLEI